MESVRLWNAILILVTCTNHNLGLVSAIPAVQNDSRTQDTAVSKSHGKSGEMSLHEAVGVGNMEQVKHLIKNGAAVNSHSPLSGQTPLHVAAMNNYTDIVAILLQNGANANAITQDGSTILHLMSAAGNLTSVKTILEHAQGLKINSPNAHGLTAFHLAAMNSHTDVMATLLQYGADINARTTDGSTVLHSAAAKGDLNVLNAILESDQAMLSAVNNDLQTPLGLARVNGQSAAVLLITTAMGDVSTFNFARATTAAQVKALQLRGATDGPGGDSGYSLLHVAAHYDLYDVLTYLVDHGAPLDNRNDLQYHQTPLFQAAHFGNLNDVRYLVENGADKTLRGWQDRTPLEEAENMGHQDVVDYLRAHGG